MRILFALLALVTIGAAPVDWSKTVGRTPQGAFVMGNPKAKVRLIEYLSYSCPHCAHFTAESSAALKANYVAKGHVVVEFRNAVRDRYDFAAALVARCGGASRFFIQNEALFAGQAELMQRAMAHESAKPPVEGAPINALLTDMADGAGLTEFVGARGVASTAVRACLTSKLEQDAVLAMTKDAWQVRKIGGTPWFTLNGQTIGATDWAGLEPKIRAALARK